MKKAGTFLLAIGLLITVITGFNFVTREKVMDVGDLHISWKNHHELEWSPIVGVVMMVIGGGVYFSGAKNK